MFLAPMLRRLAVLVPLALVSIGLPVMRGVEVPRVRHWTVRVTQPGSIRAPGEFGLVGVSWHRGRARTTPAQVRTSLDGRRWTPWTQLDFDEDDGPDRGEPRRVASTKPLWVGRARLVGLRFPGGVPPGAALELIDPGPDPAPILPAALASPRRPGVISRAQWGADESMRRGSPSYAEPLKMAIIHHTATGNTYRKGESKRIVRSIYAYHVKTNRWNDIGYNVLVDRYGQIFEGRYGGIHRAVVGAHARGFNRATTGIGVIGTFGVAKPPDSAMQALKRVVSWRLDQAWLDPQATTTYVSGGSTRWPQGRKVTVKTVSGHLDVGKTECPGDALYRALGWLRGAAARDGLPKLYEPKLSRRIITPNSDGYADGLRATGRFSSRVSWSVEVVDGEGSVLHSTTGTGTSFSAPWYGSAGNGGLVSQDGYRFRVTARNASGTVRAAYLPFEVWRYPNGTFFITASGRTYILDGGKLRHPSSWQSRATRYGAHEGVSVPNTASTVYPTGPDIGFRDGSVVSADGKLYVISDGKRRETTQETLKALRYDLDAVIRTNPSAIKPHPAGPVLTITSGLPNGAALRSSDVREAWIVVGVARPFVTRNIRDSYLIRNVDLVGPADEKIAEGASSAPVGFRDGSLLRTTGEDTVFVIADGVRRPVDPGVFEQMGFKAANVRTVTEAELSLHPEGEPL